MYFPVGRKTHVVAFNLIRSMLRFRVALSLDVHCLLYRRQKVLELFYLENFS